MSMIKVVDKKLSDKFREVAEDSLKYKLNFPYVAIISSQGKVAVAVEEIYEDGFLTPEGEFYAFVPFTFVSEKLALRIRELEKEQKKDSN